MQPESNQKIIKAHCNECQGEKNHFVRASFRRQDNDGFVWWDGVYETLQCCGCENITFRIAEQFSEDWDVRTNSSGEEEEFIRTNYTYFPRAKWRKEPKWISSLDDEDAELLKEVYSALNSDMLILGCTGARTMVDSLIKQTVGNHLGFKGSLKELVKKGHLASEDKKLLETALEAGHASAHRGWKAKRNELETVMDIIENLIQRIIVLPKPAKALMEKIPKRNKS